MIEEEAQAEIPAAPPRLQEEGFSQENFRVLKQKIFSSDKEAHIKIGDTTASFVNLVDAIKHFLPKDMGGHGKYDWIWGARYPKELPFGLLPYKIQEYLNQKFAVLNMQKLRIDEDREDIKKLVGFIDSLAEQNRQLQLSFNTKMAEYETKIQGLNGLDLENKRLLQRRESLEDAKKIMEEHRRILGSIMGGINDPNYGRVRPLAPLSTDVPLVRGRGRPPGKKESDLPPIQDEADDES